MSRMRLTLAAAPALALLVACGGGGGGGVELPMPPEPGTGEPPRVEAPGPRNIPRHNAACLRQPDRQRWADAIPDLGIDPPFISAHRGASLLAPENTIHAYRHAYAYEADTVEIDVRQIADGTFISLHDSTLDRTTDGSGEAYFSSWTQLQALNAADFAPWQGSEYDPARIPRLEEILELAQAAGKGIEFDVKFVLDYARLFELVRRYPGVMERSFFNMKGFDRSFWGALNPDVRFIHNVNEDVTPEDLYGQASTATIFGAGMSRFTAGHIAAIHDGCGWVVPHSYDQGHDQEAAEYLRGRALGIDGVQTDQPDVIRAASRSPVATRLELAEDGSRVCLLSRRNGLGLPGKPLLIDGRVTRLGDRDGCVPAAGAVRVGFAGDGSALGSEWGR